MTDYNIFITGGSGCIGHYVISELLRFPHYKLHLLTRDKKRFKHKFKPSHNVQFHQGDMETIEKHKKIIQDMDIIIHIATEWGDYDHTLHINVDKTLELFSLTDKDKCQKILYFSTASILNHYNKPLPEAKEHGTPYIRSKYLAYEKVLDCPQKEKIISLFPTAVFGGDATFPKSHLNKGLPNSLHYLKWLRWFSIDASFHFLHAFDTATVVRSLIEPPIQQQTIVLGRPPVTEKEALQDLCSTFNTHIWLTLPIPTAFIYGLLKLFKIKLTAWDNVCIQHRHFRHYVTSPSDFGIEPKFPNLKAVLRDIKQQLEQENAEKSNA